MNDCEYFASHFPHAHKNLRKALLDQAKVYIVLNPVLEVAIEMPMGIPQTGQQRL